MPSITQIGTLAWRALGAATAAFFVLTLAGEFTAGVVIVAAAALLWGAVAAAEIGWAD